VGIVGGSISGCAAAIALGRARYEPMVFERSRHGLQGRGAGIAIPGPIRDALVAARYLDDSMPFIGASVRNWAANAQKSLSCFLQLWVRKETYSKALGLGRDLDFRTIELRTGRDALVATAEGHPPLVVIDLHVAAGGAPQPWIAALAYAGLTGGWPFCS
jgi:2-polyprenyl-6-methoxyphenol hydroxylase-like FAD-dependent oxidoreductase